jgi:hypothetical protein
LQIITPKKGWTAKPNHLRVKTAQIETGKNLRGAGL